jgi:hypothetical protein
MFEQLKETLLLVNLSTGGVLTIWHHHGPTPPAAFVDPPLPRSRARFSSLDYFIIDQNIYQGWRGLFVCLTALRHLIFSTAFSPHEALL